MDISTRMLLEIHGFCFDNFIRAMDTTVRIPWWIFWDNPWDRFCNWEINCWYSASVSSDSGIKNSQLAKISGGGIPAIRFVSRSGAPLVSSLDSSLEGMCPNHDGDAPGTTSCLKGTSLAGCKQKLNHWWISGDGPLILPPTCSVAHLETAGIACDKCQ